MTTGFLINHFENQGSFLLLFFKFFSNYSWHVILYYLFQMHSIAARHLYTCNLRSDPPNKSSTRSGFSYVDMV